MLCARVRDEMRENAATAARQEAAKSDAGCQSWAAMSDRDRVFFVEESQRAWADAYDLSPETRWCMTNKRALDRQITAINVACTPGKQGSVEGSIEDAQRRCGAFPPPED